MTDRSAPLQLVQLDPTLNATLSPDLRRSLKYLLEGWTPQQLERQALRLSQDPKSGWNAYDRTLVAVHYEGPLFGDLTANQFESHEPLPPPDDGSTGSIDGDDNDSQEVDPVQITAQPTGETLIHFYPHYPYLTSMTEERFHSDGNTSQLVFRVMSCPPTLALEFQFTSPQNCLTFRHGTLQLGGQMADGNDLTAVEYTNGAGQPDEAVRGRLRALARTFLGNFPALSSQRDRPLYEQYM